MKNRFEHEINMGKEFLSRLETYLDSDEAKMLEEMTEKFYVLKQESDEKIRVLNEELRELRLRVSLMGLDKGNLLKRIEELEDCATLEKDSTGRP